MQLRHLPVALLCLFATPLAGQALAREDLPLLDAGQGDPRTREELTRGKEALERATATGEWGAYQEAVRRFEEAALRSPDLAEPWFGLALSRLALYESGSNAVISPTQPLGAGNRAAWASHIRAVLARDPRHLGALTSIGHVLLPQGDREQPAWLGAALARAESLGVVTPDLVLIRGRLARQDRRYAEAAAAFREYAARGGDPAVAALEEARALAGTGDLDAAAERYDAGLTLITPSGLALYRADLDLITEGHELDGLDRAGRAGAAEWIRRFWLRRDAADVRPEGDRLKEHLRRWVVANERYRVVEPDRRLLFHEPWAPIAPCVPKDSFNLLQAGAHEGSDPRDTRHDERILDDRGLMYLRHGDPLRIAWTLGAGDRARTADEAADRAELTSAELPRDVANAEIALRARERSFGDPGANVAEVWTYFIDGKVRSYLFRGSNWLGTTTPTTLSADVTSPELALLRAQVDPRFYTLWSRYENPFPSHVPITCMVTVQQLARDVRADLMVGGSTDDDPLFFPVAVIPAVQVAAMGHPAEGNGQVVVAYALAGDRLVPAHIDGRFTYPLRWRLTAVDSSGGIQRLEGELAPSRADSLGAREFLSGILTLPIPAGVWSVGVAIYQPDERRGGAVQARHVELDGTPVAMSDLLLGRPEDAVRWNGIPVNPLGTWHRNSTMSVYAELRGLPSGTPITTLIEVRQLDRAEGRPLVRVSTDGQSEGAFTAVRRQLDLHGLKPGVYRLSVSIRTPEGVVGTRDRNFEVVSAP